MFKKKLLTVAALAFCAAIVIAEPPKSEVNEATVGLIGDGVIDDLAFGNEEGKGVVFGKYDTNRGGVELGWGNAFGDTLWISLYDFYKINGTSAKTDSVDKSTNIEDNASNSDGVNVDYTDERDRKLTSAYNTNQPSNVKFTNYFAAGVGINNTFGIQAAWLANWENKKDVVPGIASNEGKTFGTGATATTVNVYRVKAYGNGDTTTVSEDNTNSKSGESSSEKYSKIKNFNRQNKIILNFKGAGIETDSFYAKLNKIYSDLNFTTTSLDYTKSTSVRGATTESITGNGIDQTIAINPGLEAEVGFNLPEIGVMKSTLSFTDDFNMKFNVVKNKTTYTTVTEKYGTTGTTTRTTDTVTTDYEYKPGKKLYWANTLTPKFTMEFDLLDQLTLKSAVSADVLVKQDNQDAGKAKAVKTSTTKDFYTGNTTSNVTETVEYGDATNTHIFETSVTPKIALGLVYQLIPGKTNINFGFEVKPGAYTWTTTEKTNSNINDVYTKDDVTAYGTTTTSKKVNVANSAAETREVKFNNADTTFDFGLGATWFFTENAKFDVTYKTQSDNLFSGSSFGVDFAVMF